MVGAVIDILIRVCAQHLAHVVRVAARGLRSGVYLVQMGVFVQARRICGQLVFQHKAGAGHNHHVHHARVALAQVGQRRHVARKAAFVHAQKLLEQVAVLAVVHIVVLGFQKRGLGVAFQVNPPVAEGNLVFYIRLILHHPGVLLAYHAGNGEGGLLGKVAVFQLGMRAFGPQRVQHREAHEKHKEHNGDGVCLTGLPYFFHSTSPPFIRTGNRGTGCWWHPPYRRW